MPGALPSSQPSGCIRSAAATPATLARLLAGLVGGAVGAGLTQLGAAQFALGLRRPRRFAVTCAVGAAAGLLFYLGDRNIIDARLLFIVWQPAVAFCIGLGLASPAGPLGQQEREQAQRRQP